MALENTYGTIFKKNQAVLHTMDNFCNNSRNPFENVKVAWGNAGFLASTSLSADQILLKN
jgi:hypothetical protein